MRKREKERERLRESRKRAMQKNNVKKKLFGKVKACTSIAYNLYMIS